MVLIRYQNLRGYSGLEYSSCGERKHVHRNLAWKLLCNCPFARPGTKWEDSISFDLKELVGRRTSED
jgi:hypothetical protein